MPDSPVNPQVTPQLQGTSLAEGVDWKSTSERLATLCGFWTFFGASDAFLALSLLEAMLLRLWLGFINEQERGISAKSREAVPHSGFRRSPCWRSLVAFCVSFPFGSVGECLSFQFGFKAISES